MSAYGLYMVTWSVFEYILEFVIESQAGLKPIHAAIIATGLGFERKAPIARSLLSLDPQYAKAISTINKITQEAGCNSIVHGTVYVGERGNVYRATG